MKKTIAIPITVAIVENARNPSSSFPSARNREKIGMNVMDRAPPARRWFRKSGIVNAAK